MHDDYSSTTSALRPMHNTIVHLTTCLHTTFLKSHQFAHDLFAHDLSAPKISRLVCSRLVCTRHSFRWTFIVAVLSLPAGGKRVWHNIAPFVAHESTAKYNGPLRVSLSKAITQSSVCRPRIAISPRCSRPLSRALSGTWCAKPADVFYPPDRIPKTADPIFFISTVS